MVCNIEVKQAYTFKYLVEVFSEDYRIKTDLDARISAVNRLYGAIKQ